MPEKSTLPSAVRGAGGGACLVVFAVSPWRGARSAAKDKTAATATAATIEPGKRLLTMAPSSSASRQTMLSDTAHSRSSLFCSFAPDRSRASDDAVYCDAWRAIWDGFSHCRHPPDRLRDQAPEVARNSFGSTGVKTIAGPDEISKRRSPKARDGWPSVRIGGVDRAGTCVSNRSSIDSPPRPSRLKLRRPEPELPAHTRYR